MQFTKNGGTRVIGEDEQSMIGVGVDFGTSNSVAAWYDGEEVHLVMLEEATTMMPSAMHLDRKLLTLTGQAAVTQYIEDNRDRVVELVSEVIAKASLSTGCGLTEQPRPDAPDTKSESSAEDVYGEPWVDPGLRGRLFLGVKRLLGNTAIKRIMVFDAPFRLVALITPILLRIRQAIEYGVCGPPEVQDRPGLAELAPNTHFGHPVQFERPEVGLAGGRRDESSESSNALAFERLSEACAYAGLTGVIFYPEPVAATLSYRHGASSPQEGCVLTLDFGGGTLDLSVVEYSGSRFNVLATAGTSLGGDHIDQLIYQELLFPYLGKGERWSRVRDGHRIENDFPFEQFEDKLLNWAVTYLLNQGQYRAKIVARINQGGAGTDKFERLLSLITHNYSYLVFQAIKDAKVTLSSQDETVIDIPELDLVIPFTRRELDQMMHDILGRIEAVISEVLQAAGREVEQIDQVIRTGGSSQIVAVKQLLEARFPNRVTEHDPFTSVAAGLAIASYHGFEFHDDARRKEQHKRHQMQQEK